MIGLLTMDRNARPVSELTPKQGALEALALRYHTVKYLSRRQCWCRLRHVVVRRIRRVLGTRAPYPTVQNTFDAVTVGMPAGTLSDDADWIGTANAAARDVDALCAGQLSVLDHIVQFSGAPDWHSRELSQLQRYHQHYFEFVPQLVVNARQHDDRDPIDTFCRLVDSWIAGNERLTGDGWHPYTISLRVNNWLLAAAEFDSALKEREAFYGRFKSSLFGQCRFLAGNLEHDVRGNHLLKNLRALIAAGVCFSGREPSGWLASALNTLQIEVDEQVHSDGGHFERSPGYHCAVLQDLIEIAVWLERFDGRRIDWLDSAIRRMGEFLSLMVSGDERLPLFKDTAINAAPNPDDLLACASLHLDDPDFKSRDRYGRLTMLLFGADGCRRFREFPVSALSDHNRLLDDTGYVLISRPSSDSRLMIDVGKPCPDYLPAHAHADLLSFELTLDGQPLIVDSGVYEYQAGPWRDFFRSTRAHNTVEVNGLNQSEVWSSFRVGRRARPRNCCWQANHEYALIQAEHDGYRRIGVPVDHRRTVIWHEGRFLLIVDELFGRGRFEFSSYLHFHPDRRVECEDGGMFTIDACLGETAHVVPFGHESTEVVRGRHLPVLQGWYADRFGTRHPNTVLVLNSKGTGIQRSGYVISFAQPVRAGFGTQTTDSASVAVASDEDRFELQLQRHGEPVYGRAATEDRVLQPLFHTGNRSTVRASA